MAPSLGSTDSFEENAGPLLALGLSPSQHPRITTWDLSRHGHLGYHIPDISYFVLAKK
ncbi:hypothetical protein MGG_16874 [Pyricularia oryzae 70-15]|uniref:Uncharacterized protein n=1 Tax=Pyricularia oryzae (strain 70-15 / ATCC MYA-4617 / FGSC 8958) TaxID=242507 RepID=G4N4H1_PYRO7|nr:uncharacterized protein MGG_16874 [Pyricularia oryzae 70-15]EHA52839.1 hypothetical protein MGG_16874 [Pyricularia oryzae 70-15]KAI7918944.1 hypothetical protein M0657_007330 [Pyricularia oryzae]KAI7930580.1 hypothetical protein M9X92_000644 [Pyricularia oryzae]